MIKNEKMHVAFKKIESQMDLIKKAKHDRVNDKT
jgi:hypothetical protein